MGMMKQQQTGHMQFSSEGKQVLAPALVDAFRIGQVMDDGSLYAGVSPDTGRSMFATFADAAGTYALDESLDCAARLDVHRQKDWRVPSRGELRVMFDNLAGAAANFNRGGALPSGWYRSSSRDTSFSG